MQCPKKWHKLPYSQQLYPVSCVKPSTPDQGGFLISGGGLFRLNRTVEFFLIGKHNNISSPKLYKLLDPNFSFGKLFIRFYLNFNFINQFLPRTVLYLNLVSTSRFILFFSCVNLNTKISSCCFLWYKAAFGRNFIPYISPLPQRSFLAFSRKYKGDNFFFISHEQAPNFVAPKKAR